MARDSIARYSPLAPEALWRKILAIAAVVIALHVIANAVYLTFPDWRTLKVMRWFDLGAERNLPTAFSVFILVCASVLLAMVCRQEQQQGKGYAGEWGLLSGLVLLLALDEGLELHEMLVEPAKQWLHPDGGVFAFGWVAPALVVLMAACLRFHSFYGSLCRDLKLRLFAAAAVYFGGAVGGDMVAGALGELYKIRWVRFVEVTMEESLEIGGVLILIHTLLALIEPLEAAAGNTAGILSPANVSSQEHVSSGRFPESAGAVWRG